MAKTKLIATFVIILSVIPFPGCQTGIKTPGSKLQANVSANRAGRLTYQVERGNSIVIERSPLGITVDGVDLGDGVTVGPAEQRTIDETYATRGVHSTAVNNCRVNRIPITHKATNTNYYSGNKNVQ